MKKYLASLVMAFCCFFACHGNAQETENKGFYAQLLGGVSFMTANHWQYFHPGYSLGCSLGYKYCAFRCAGEFLYQKIDLRKNRLGNRPKGPEHSYWYMANVFYDFSTRFAFKPYIGGGLGYCHWTRKVLNAFHGFGISETYVFKKKKNGVAGQVIIGVSYPICRKTEIAIEGRYQKGHKQETLNAELALCRYF